MWILIRLHVEIVPTFTESWPPSVTSGGNSKWNSSSAGRLSLTRVCNLSSVFALQSRAFHEIAVTSSRYVRSWRRRKTQWRNENRLSEPKTKCKCKNIQIKKELALLSNDGQTWQATPCLRKWHKIADEEPKGGSITVLDSQLNTPPSPCTSTSQNRKQETG